MVTGPKRQVTWALPSGLLDFTQAGFDGTLAAWMLKYHVRCVRFELCKAASGYSGVLMLGKFRLQFPVSS